MMKPIVKVTLGGKDMVVYTKEEFENLFPKPHIAHLDQICFSYENKEYVGLPISVWKTIKTSYDRFNL